MKAGGDSGYWTAAMLEQPGFSNPLWPSVSYIISVVVRVAS